jgi:Resolvase, N terminal domain
VVRGENKVGRQHLRRTALIYIRQSTMAQVRDHTESTARQYALAEEAARLGWPASAIEVIDADLGVSGRSVEGRDGFKGLVARVCLGEIGAIFGLEVSRLARSSDTGHRAGAPPRPPPLALLILPVRAPTTMIKRTTERPGLGLALSG